MTKKVKIIICISIAAVILITGIIFILAKHNNTPDEDIATLSYVDQGNEYLIALSYDKAVIEFTEAIRVDPMNADAYIGLAKAYEGLGEKDKARETLEEGFERTGDERIKEMLDTIMAETASEETITTADTPPMIKVPDLKGKTEDEAIKIGEELGIEIEIQREPSDEVPEGEVINQDIPVGSEIEDGEKIVIVVSEGKELEYTVELVEEFIYDTENYNFETGEYDRIYTLKSDLNLLNTSINYPYIRRHGHGEYEEVGMDSLYYDYSYEGEIYYSIETETSSIKLPEKYYLVEQFSENMAYFRRDKVENKKTYTYTAGYIDTTGKEIFSYKVEEEYAGSWGGGSRYGPLSFDDYENNFDMIMGTAALTTDGEHYGLIDKNGNVVVKPKYDYVCTFTDDMAVVGIWNDGIKYGFVNKNGELVIDMKFDEILWGFEDGLAIVGIQGENNRNKYGVIDKSGNWIVPCKYSTCYISDNGNIVVGVEKERKTEYGTQRYTHYGLYDKTGNLILEPSYTFIYSGSPLEINGTQIRRSSDKFIYGDADSVILAENDNGVLLYDLNSNLITSADNYCIDYYNNEGYGIALMFDPTGILKITERTDDYSIEGQVKFIDKSGNVYNEHPYGLDNYDYFYKTDIDGYYTFFYCNYDDWSTEGKTYKIS